MVKTKKQQYLENLEQFLHKRAKILRNKRTKWEAIMYSYLKQIGYKFKFQVPAICRNKYGYILDFLLTDYNLIIEIDGKAFHNSKEQKKKDNQRTRRLLKEGFHLIRLSNKQVSVLTKEQIHDIISTKILHIVNKR